MYVKWCFSIFILVWATWTLMSNAYERLNGWINSSFGEPFSLVKFTSNYCIGSIFSSLNEMSPSKPFMINDVILVDFSGSAIHRPLVMLCWAVMLMNPRLHLKVSWNFSLGFSSINGFFTFTSRSMISMSCSKSKLFS